MLELFERLPQDDPFYIGVLLTNKAIGLFDCLPQDDVERRINRGLRPDAFEKGKKIELKNRAVVFLRAS